MKFSHPAALLTLSLSALTLLPGCATVEPTSRDRFAEADANRDGKLSRQEVAHYLVLQTFEARDTNADGKITLVEWNPASDKVVVKKFTLVDGNKDGAVTIEEATAFVAKGDMVKKFVLEADSDNDGFVSRDEARTYYASKEGPVR